MGLLKNFFGSFKKHEELELAKGFKAAFKVPPNRLNNLSIMERNIKFFDSLGTDSLDKEGLELRQWYKTEVQKNVKLMESEGLRFSSD